jgi:hypothetical protein
MPQHGQHAAYDKVPSFWTPSSESDLPPWAASPVYVRSMIAWNDPKKSQAVEIRGGVSLGHRQCRGSLGDVFVTSHGTVLGVRALSDAHTSPVPYKGTPRGGDHYPESAWVQEHAILLDDVRSAVVWCRHHGEWDLGLQNLKYHVRVWRATHKTQTMVSIPPRLG